MWYWYGDGGNWIVLSGFIMALLWTGILGLAFWGIVRLTRHSGTRKGAYEIVRERYARGEISKEELERFNRDL